MNKLLLTILIISTLLCSGCTELPDTTDRYSHVYAEARGTYEYSTGSNDPILLDGYFDITNTGNYKADNVQVDYSILISGKVLDSGTLYVGTLNGGQYTNRKLTTVVELTDSEWKRLKNDMVNIEFSVDEIRSE